MSGNVSEWCQDWYSAYPGTDTTDYSGPTTAQQNLEKVVRGNSFSGNAAASEVSARGSAELYNAFNFIGFRVARW